jgi:hypothetical protein
METIGLYLIAIALVGVGCAATVLSAYVFPLWIRVRGQAHGRFAGLSGATEADFVDGSKRKAGGAGLAGAKQPAPSLMVA